jgi:lipoate-protein ligase A
LNAAVIGIFQSVTLEVNLEACKELGTALARRFTGGGAVYHDLGNLDYAISIPKDHQLVKNDIGETFAALSAGAIEGLKTLGICAILEPPHNLQVNGRKIGGASGAIKSGFVFYHGSILVNSNLKALSRALESRKERSERHYVQSIKKEVSTLTIELARNPAMSEVKGAMKTGFEKAFNIKLAEGEVTEEEKRLGEKLLKEKYSTDTWNLGK